MFFCSLKFAWFFALVFSVYWLPPWRRLSLRLPLPGRRSFLLTGDEARIWLLLVASFFFYAAWNEWLALLICASTVMDYCLALGMESSRTPRLRKTLLAISLAANLGLLCFFKYANFFLESFYDGLGWARDSSHPLLDILLPVGISFYTFEAINYTIDVYRGKVRAERNLAHFMLFILFFPHLIAGPIVRARDFLPQVRRRKRWNWTRCQVGVELILLGLLKKWALSDRLAVYVDPVFAFPDWYSTSASWVAIFAYALQIYGDFSGYSDMALGTAHLLGYRLAVNFNMPYVALNIADYWHRWHISLSTWLRDYLFIPLGGSRGTRWQTYRNLLVTMTLGGLWHGANWTFVAWGSLNGLALAIHRAFRSSCQKRPRLTGLLESPPGTGLRLAFTFVLVCLGYVFFRSPTFAVAATVFRHMLWPHDGLPAPLNLHCFWYTSAAFVLFHVAAHVWVPKRLGERLPTPVLGAGYAAALALCLVLAPQNDKHFIYFQF